MYLHWCGCALQENELTCCVYVMLQTLLDDIKGDTGGDFEDLLVALITPPAVYDCHEVMRAMKVSLSCFYNFLS